MFGYSEVTRADEPLSAMVRNVVEACSQQHRPHRVHPATLLGALQSNDFILVPKTLCYMPNQLQACELITEQMLSMLTGMSFTLEVGNFTFISQMQATLQVALIEEILQWNALLLESMAIIHENMVQQVLLVEASRQC